MLPRPCRSCRRWPCASNFRGRPRPRPSAMLQVSRTQFDDAAAKAPTVKPPADGNGSADSGVVTELEILDKPRPKYTDEARRLHIEGEVLLQTVFEASGRIRVLRIVRGLGHGLDENAVTAANAIRVRPAHPGGQAPETAAVWRVRFTPACCGTRL